MWTDDDLIDIIVESLTQRNQPTDWRLAKGPMASSGGHREGKWGFHVQTPYNPSWTSLPMKRPFISDFMVRHMVSKDKKEIRIPKNAIVSPLAEEWLTLNGIKIKREDR